MTKAVILASFVGLLAIAAVGSAAGLPPEASPPAGAVEGTVTYDGQVTKAAVPDARGLRQELLTVDRRSAGLEFAAVYLVPSEEGGFPASGDAPSQALVIEQKEYRFVPRVAAVRAGQPVRFTNSDQGNHNVRAISFDERNQFNT